MYKTPEDDIKIKFICRMKINIICTLACVQLVTAVHRCHQPVTLIPRINFLCCSTMPHIQTAQVKPTILKFVQQKTNWSQNPFTGHATKEDTEAESN